MILLSLDVETTGLDREKDRITEVGAVLWSTNFGRSLEAISFFVDPGIPIPDDVSKLTKINNAMVQRFGADEQGAIEDLIRLANQADAFIGQNVRVFDRSFLVNAALRHGLIVPDKLWIDTQFDMPPTCISKTLPYMAADHGFLNPFPHAALFDAMTVLKIVGMYDLDEIVRRAKEPEVVVQSLQGFDANNEAKKLGFGFKPNLGKRWLKIVKKFDLESLAKEAKFDIKVVTDVSTQDVLYS